MKLFTTWGASLVASGFSFFSNLLMARILSVQDYVTYISLLGIVGFFNILQPSMQSITARQIALDSVTKTEEECVARFRLMWIVGLSFAIIGGIFLQILSPWIAQITLSDHNLVQFLPLCFSFGLISSISMGELQGKQRAGSIALVTLLSAFLRFPISLILVTLGLAIYGAVLSLPIVAAIVAIITSALSINFKLKPGPQKIAFLPQLIRYINLNTFFRVISTSILPIMTYIGFLALTSIDIILVKRFLAPDVQSYYALIATLGKIALYATQPIAILLLPRATTLTGQLKSTRKLLWQNILLTMGVGILTCVALLLGGPWITYLFMPSFPNHLVPLIALYAFSMSLIGLVFVLNNFCIAVNAKPLALLQAIIVLILCGIFMSQTLSLLSAISIMIVGAFILCLGGIAILLRHQITT